MPGSILMAEGTQGGPTPDKDRINRALQAFRDARNVFSSDSSLPTWAQLQINVGRALGMLSTISEAAEALKFLDDAEAAFEEVLHAVNREEMPQLWAQAQIGVGQVAMDRWQRNPGQNDPELIQKAEQAVRSALEVLRPNRDSGIWLQGEQDLYRILMDEAGGNNSDQARISQQQAIDVCQAILNAWPKDKAPELWAQTQRSIGDSAVQLAYISDADKAPGLLDKAIRAYQEAQTFYTRDANPDTWAQLQSHIAGTNLDLAERSEGDARRKLASQAGGMFENMLGILNPESNASQWGWAEMELGRARMDEAEADPKTARPLLDKSIELSRKTLKAIRKEQDPVVWEKAQFNLGQALEDEAQLAGPDEVPSLSRQAADAFGAVLEVDPRENNARSRISSILQDELFDYEKAFAVNSAYANAVQGDFGAELDFIEVHLSTGRFEECLRRSARLRTDANPNLSARVILGLLEIGCDLGLRNREAANAKFAEIDHLFVSPDFQQAIPNWSFNGTKHFLNTSPEFAEYKEALTQLLDAVESGDIEAIRRNLKPVGASLARAGSASPEK
jgi:tetratricopeptide (TPR) repeat protein